MKSLAFALTAVVAFGLNAHADEASDLSSTPSAPNAAVAAQIQALFFGDTDNSIERAPANGVTPDGQPCELGIRKTRWGIYAWVKIADKTTESGVTNSHYTTSDLKFEHDTVNGVIRLSRVGETNIDERGSDVNKEKLVLTYVPNDAKAILTSVQVSLEKLDFKKQPTGHITTATCALEDIDSLSLPEL